MYSLMLGSLETDPRPVRAVYLVLSLDCSVPVVPNAVLLSSVV